MQLIYDSIFFPIRGFCSLQASHHTTSTALSQVPVTFATSLQPHILAVLVASFVATFTDDAVDGILILVVMFILSVIEFIHHLMIIPISFAQILGRDERPTISSPPNPHCLTCSFHFSSYLIDLSENWEKRWKLDEKIEKSSFIIYKQTRNEFKSGKLYFLSERWWTCGGWQRRHHQTRPQHTYFHLFVFGTRNTETVSA